MRIRAGELALPRSHFDNLQAGYSPDLACLQSIAEGGYVLAAMAHLDCPVCGKSLADLERDHEVEEISIRHMATAAETRKIEREQAELS